MIDPELAKALIGLCERMGCLCDFLTFVGVMWAIGTVLRFLFGSGEKK